MSKNDLYISEERSRAELENAKMKASSDARIRRIHQVKIERLIKKLLKDKGFTDLEEIHYICEVGEVNSKQLIGSIISKLAGQEYVKSEEREGTKEGFVYVKGRRFNDWDSIIDDSGI